MKVTFEEIKYPATKRMKCFTCGKSYRRSKTFTMTLNPWNKNEDGTIRTRDDIRKALQQKAQEWEAISVDDHHDC